MRIVKDQQLSQKILQQSKVQDLFDMNILEKSQLYVFQKNEYIIQEGVVSQYLYIFLEGKLKVFTLSPGGKVIMYAVFDRSRPVGEMGSLWGSPPTASVQASEVSYCLGIDLGCHREAIFNDNRFLRYLCRLLSDRVVALDSQLANVVAISSDVRLAAFLLQAADDHDLVDMDLGETAAIISTSYRHLLRMLDDFCDKGLLQKEKSAFRIADKKGLEYLATEFFDHSYIS